MAFRQAKAAKIGGKLLSYGESGSGKTSLLNILALIDTPTTGSLIINNKLINFKDTKKTNSFRDANIYDQ